MQNVEPKRVLDASVLVLNRYYMAIRVITVRRAFVLLYRDAAEVIDIENGHYMNYDFTSWCDISRLMYEEPEAASLDEEWVKAVSFRLRVPRILRLTRFDRVIRQSLRFNRKNLFARDGYQCQYCGKTLPPSQLSMDHVVPRSRGGKTSWDNIVCSCVNCNTRKGGRTPSEARMNLICKPKQPTMNPVLRVKLDNPKYESWKTFLPQYDAAVDAG